MTPYIVLFLAHLYFIGKSLWPDVVTGKIVYPAVFAAAFVLFVIRSVRMKRFIAGQVSAVMLFGLVASGFLFIYGYTESELRKVETSVSLYFGVLPLLFLFYVIFQRSQFDPMKAIRMIALLLAVESVAEFAILNVNPRSEYLIHYDGGTLSDARNRIENRAERASAVGLLANRSNTASYAVALMWLYFALLNAKEGIKIDRWVFLIALTFLVCLSGTAFTVLAISIVIIRRQQLLAKAVVFVLLVIALGTVSSYARKVTLTYFDFMVGYKASVIGYFLGIVYDRPEVLAVGATTEMISDPRFGVSSDFSALKMITDIGLLPVILYFLLIKFMLKNAKYAFPVRASQQCFKLFLLSLILGTMHYPVLFSFPVQTTFAAMLAWTIRIRESRALRRTVASSTPTLYPQVANARS